MPHTIQSWLEDPREHHWLLRPQPHQQRGPSSVYSVHVSSPIKWAMDLLPMQYPSSTNYINRKPLSGMQIRGKNFIFNHCLPEFISWKLNDMYMHILRFCTIVTLRWQWYLKPYFMGDKGLFYPNSKKNTYRLLVTRWRNFKEPGHFDGPVVQ